MDTRQPKICHTHTLHLSHSSDNCSTPHPALPRPNLHQHTHRHTSHSHINYTCSQPATRPQPTPQLTSRPHHHHLARQTGSLPYRGDAPRRQDRCHDNGGRGAKRPMVLGMSYVRRTERGSFRGGQLARSSLDRCSKNSIRFV